MSQAVTTQSPLREGTSNKLNDNKLNDTTPAVADGSSFNAAAATISTPPTINLESSPLKKQKLFVSPILLPLATSIPRLTSASPPSPISFVSPTTIEFDELSQAFNSSCRCQASKQNLNNSQQKEQKHHHLDVQKIYAKLAESNHAASFPITSASSSPPVAPRCSCIQLSVASSSSSSANANANATASSSAPLKRRYDNVCTPSTPVSEFNSFSLASASASPPMDSSMYERAYVRVKKSYSAASGLGAPIAGGTAVTASSSTAMATAASTSFRPSIAANNASGDSASPNNDDDSPFEDDSVSPPILATFNCAPTLSSAASTASMSPSHSPIIPQTVDLATSSGKSLPSSKTTTAAKPAGLPAMEYDEEDIDAYQHSAADMDEIFRLEDEENESELQFLMNTKLGHTQQDQHHMPYIL